MKIIFLSMISSLLYFQSAAQAFTDINSQTIPLSSLNQSKLLIMFLPPEPDTGMLNQVLRFQGRHTGQVKIIGLVSLQPGALPADSLKNIYRQAITAGVIITEGMFAQDTTAGEREGIIQWLSGKNRNRQAEPSLTGSKYFISKNGRLYAQLGGFASLDSPVADNIINTTVPGEN